MFVEGPLLQRLKEACQHRARRVFGVLCLSGAKLVLGLFIAFSAMCHGQMPVVADSYISQSSPTTNYGGGVSLWVQSNTWTFLQFDLSTLPASTTADQIEKATLVLFATQVTATGSFDIYEVGAPWTESGISWNSQPGSSTLLTTGSCVSPTVQCVTDGSASNYLVIDVTQAVKDWVGGTAANNGLLLQPTNGSSVSVSFASKEDPTISHAAWLNVVLYGSGEPGPQGPQGETGAIGPQGATGAQGATGQGFNFRGALASGTSYNPYDVVTYGGQSYQVITAYTTPTDLSSYNASTDPNLSLMAVAGAAGAQGPQGTPGTPGGPQGPQGPTGPAGTVTATGTNGDFNVPGKLWTKSFALGSNCPPNLIGKTGVPAGCSVAAWVPNPSQFTNSLIVGNGGNYLSSRGINPVDNLPFENNGSFNGANNTFFGMNAGLNNTTGNGNTFVGASAGMDNQNGDQNTFLGWFAGESNISGFHNTFLGVGAGQSNTTGYFNVYIGTDDALFANGGNFNVIVGTSAGSYNSGSANVFLGTYSGTSNQAGSENTFVGQSSGASNTTGVQNTFLGRAAGSSNATGYRNTLVGWESGFQNQTGYNNTFTGTQSGYANTTGSDLTFLGANSGHSNNTGTDNTFVGSESGYTNNAGGGNTFEGAYAGFMNSSGSFNTYIGGGAGQSSTGSEDTFIGQGAGVSNSSGAQNTVVGRHAGGNLSSGSGNTAIGYEAGPSAGTETNTVAIGNGATTSSTVPIMIGNCSTGACVTIAAGPPSGSCQNGSLYVSTTGSSTNLVWACGSGHWQLIK